jgi:hypothetical protein
MTTFGRKYLLGMGIALGALTAISGTHQCGAATWQQAQDAGPDPTDQNMAPVDGSQAYQQQYGAQGTVNESQQQAIQATQQGAPIERRAPSDDDNQQQGDYGNQQQDSQQAYSQDDQNYDPNYESNVDAGQEAIEADEPPPPLPVYQQPEAPEPNYIWTPGYWGWAPIGYYWVPGVWCAAPYYGALWTPSYWGFYGGRYRFHHGFWGLHIGFYGGINYGYGYFGMGYRGGYWDRDRFYYNRSVNNINVNRITNVYNHPVGVNNYNNNRISYNGGRGGLQVRPRPTELAAMRETRIPPMRTQLQVQREAVQNRQQFYSQNRGRPAIVAAPKAIVADRGIQRPIPGQFNRPGQGQQMRPGPLGGQQQMPQVQPARPSRTLQQGNQQPQLRPAPQQDRQQMQVQRPQYQGRPGTDIRQEQQQLQQQQWQQQNQQRMQQQQQRMQQEQMQLQQRQQARPQNQPSPQPQMRPAPQPRQEAPRGVKPK